MEVWTAESWTDHLREAGRLSPEDRALLARAAAFQGTRPEARPRCWVAVEPPRAAGGAISPPAPHMPGAQKPQESPG